jgi:hypothetical protein
MTVIDVGSDAIDRALDTSATRTYILLNNPANLSGILNRVLVYGSNWVGLRVGTFFLVSGTTYRCRDSVAVANGTGYQEFLGLTLIAQAGDYLGFYHAGGAIDISLTGTGMMNTNAGVELIDPGDQGSFTGPTASRDISLYADGITVTDGLTQDTIIFGDSASAYLSQKTQLGVNFKLNSRSINLSL